MNFKDIIYNRRAVNFFDADKNVTEAEIKEMIEMAAYTPSSFNLQPWSVLILREKEEKEISEFHEFEFDGFKIRVGKNSKNNDKLTFGNAYKEDLWLHVKDAKGSHVLLKYRSDRKFSKIAIEKAAQLAAYYSKRSTEGLVPVIYTPKKYIRKRKGDPPGLVVVDKEEVLLVEPEKW